MMIDRIIRTKRKTIALIVENDGSLTVRAPLRISRRSIVELVEQKSDWIRSKRELAKKLAPVSDMKAYVSGETFWYLGVRYPLEITPTAEVPLRLDGRFVLGRAALAEAGETFTRWYKEQAMQMLEERVHWYATRYGLSYKKIKITSAQGRWGSCSTQGILCFSWRLVMVPPEQIDYVVVHELMHLQEKNHAKAFWRKVEAIMPDYKTLRKGLRQNGHLLRTKL
jgi:predicted metal-dependent hydrolase